MEGGAVVDKKISVIIPVYNVEAYLEECLESVIKQTYQNTEILLIDDASPDNCGEICDRYAAADERVRVIHKEKNCGQAAARNTGMELATGEFLFFADSDDWLAENTLEKLYEGLKKYHADCSIGTCVIVLEGKNGKKSFQRGKDKGERCETSRDVMKHTLLVGSAAWNRLYKREIIEGLRFRQGRINDDEAFALYAYERMNKIVFLSDKTYFYRKRANSITTSAFSVKMIDCVYNSKDNLQFIIQRAPELKSAAEYKYFKSMLWCYVNLRKLNGDEQARILCRQLHKEIKEHRSMALSNPYLGVCLKMLMVICSF